MRFLCFSAVVGILILCASSAPAQVYSYLDQNGIRVFTNIPPTGRVWDLTVSGAPEPPPPAPPAAPGKKSTVKAKPAANPAVATAAAKVPAPGNPGAPTDTTPGSYDNIIQKYASAYNVDPKLIHSMIATESSFNSKAVSPKGAQGLMQLMPATASRMGVRNAFDPEENISGGTKYMRLLLDTFSYAEKDQLILSLAAYNAGENLVQKLGRVPAIRETSEYVSSILGRYGQKIMSETPAQPPRITGPSTFDYVDEQGIHVFTNIPPVLGRGTTKNGFR